MTDFHQVNEVLDELEKKAVVTSQGSYIRLEDVRKMIQDRRDDKKTELEEELLSRRRIKTVEQARSAAKKDPDVQEFFKGKGSLEPGRATPASPPVAVEGVKA